MSGASSLRGDARAPSSLRGRAGLVPFRPRAVSVRGGGTRISGCSSVVERNLAKVDVEGSSPFSRSTRARCAPTFPEPTGAHGFARLPANQSSPRAFDGSAMEASTRRRDARSAAKLAGGVFGRCLLASIFLHGLALAAALGVVRSELEPTAGRRAPTVFARPASLREFAPSTSTSTSPGEVEQVVPPEPRLTELADVGAQSERTAEEREPELERAWASDDEPRFGRSSELPSGREHADEAVAAAESGTPAPVVEPPGDPAPEPAVWIEGPDPAYPRLSVRFGEEGTVVCRLAIDARGDVAHVLVLSSSGHARLDRAAVDALARWRFRAAHTGGVSVPSELVHRVVFRLSGRR